MLIFSCGFPNLSFIDSPIINSIEGSTQFASILLTSDYMKNINNFQGVSFFYKIYPDSSIYYGEGSLNSYRDFKDADTKDANRFESSYDAKIAMKDLKYLPFQRTQKKEDESLFPSSPTIEISKDKQIRDILLTLDFSKIQTPSSAERGMIIQIDDNLNKDKRIFYRSFTDQSLNNQGFETLSNQDWKGMGESNAKYDDMKYVPEKFKDVSDYFNIIVYVVIYAGDVFNTVQSQPFRVGYVKLFK